MASRARTNRIGVGIDGSSASEDALRWAVDQATATGASRLALTTWSIPTLAYGMAVPPLAPYSAYGAACD